MKQYTESQKYDESFISENMMGPNSMWLLEEVCQHLDLKPGMRVLDMGCGKGLTSIFLAKEYGVTVYATDLWISATENFERFKAFGLENQVIPIHAEAHNLPYADDYFDAAVSIDSYHYYGANDTYLPEHFARLVKRGGQFGITAPGLTRDVSGGVPDSLRGIWKEEPDAFSTFKSAQWWHDTWQKSGLVDVKVYGEIEDIKEMWRHWAEIARKRFGFNDDEMLKADTENYMTFVYFTAVKK
jgi:cyclopropane fatty-acyl-phospholipid synthase-like methyltransferase